MTRTRLPVVVTLLLLGSLAFAGGSSEPPLPLPEGYSAARTSGITFQWGVDGERLHVRLAAATSGWIAVGFDPSQRMNDSNIIIGYVKDGQVYLRDDFGTGETSHSSDEFLGGSNDIGDPQGEESDGRTTLSFTIPLDPGDRYDRPLEVGKSYRVNLASGSSDDFGSYHSTRRGTVNMQL